MKKRQIILVIILLTCSLSVMAFIGKDIPIRFQQLPATAQQMIQKHFPNQKIALAKMENELLSKSYEVIFTNGTKIEFDSKGQWTNIDCKYSQVPSALIPSAILSYVKKNYKQSVITEVERKRRSIQIELNNGIDLTFNSKYQLIKID